MHFKVDENLPSEAAGILTTARYDALTIHDQQLVGTPDPHIMSVCLTEKRALIMLDLDFADIRAYPPGDFHGIVVLRPRTQSRQSVLTLLNNSSIC
jgi:predicted nuclease of predicted toxin-antitoxin system